MNKLVALPVHAGAANHFGLQNAAREDPLLATCGAVSSKTKRNEPPFLPGGRGVPATGWKEGDRGGERGGWRGDDVNAERSVDVITRPDFSSTRICGTAKSPRKPCQYFSSLECLGDLALFSSQMSYYFTVRPSSNCSIALNR